ncbi:hypothetical protein GU926_01795 [Nibribacter ruber]|uniref:Uncharacterized protein n=1 Tax=Nibribacter ruber TaxID=2698458 RepID=A0A6P1NV78_9BACT|nr:hypothetical protein [Nibribacter ruber]QHL86244.1 hypothetical protein GU926_01795 [Nibribacter ruber]
MMVAILIFIYKSNDHLECQESSRKEVTASGCEVITTTHHCRERFAI